MDDREALPSKIKSIYFPILLTSTLKEVFINEHISIKRIDNKDCREALGIKNVVYRFNRNGTIKSFKNLKNPRQMFRFAMPHLSNPRFQAELFSLNFALVAESMDDAERFQQAMKLLNPMTRSGISIGFAGTTTFYVRPTPYRGKERFTISSRSVLALKGLIDKFCSLRNDKKLSVILQKYLYALSSEGFSEAHRFLDLAIIMEMLLLPKNSQEVAYKFRLRFANLLKKKIGSYSKADIRDLYATGKLIYDIRSKIVHTGFDPRARDNLETLSTFVQQSILLYLDSNALFHDEALDKICLL